jgi:hypothetical protein
MIPKSGVGFSLEIMFKRMENPTAPEPLLVSSPGAVSTRRQGRRSARVQLQSGAQFEASASVTYFDDTYFE